MLNILIISDETAVRSNFSKVLKPRGFNVAEAGSGQEGIRLVEKQEFDLVFVSSRLHDVDGIRILDLVNKKKRDLPVVLCCGLDELSIAIQAVKSGAYDFIEEPFKNSDILRISREILIKSGKSGLNASMDIEESQYVSDVARKKLKYLGIGIAVFLLVLVSVLEINNLYNRKAKNKLSVENSDSVVKIERIERKTEAIKTENSIKPDIAVEKKKEKVVIDLPVISAKEKIYPVSYFHPSGIYRSGEYLWVCDWFSQSIYKHKLDEKLTLLKTFSTGDLHPSGLAIINEYLWVTDSWDRTVTKFRIDNELVLVKTYKVQEQSPSGLMFDGTSIWLCDATSKKISKHWMDNELTMSYSLQSPGESPVTLYWDGTNIISGDRDSGIIYFHKSIYNLLEVEKFQNETLKSKKGKFSGFTSDRDYFWMVFDGIGSIYRLSKDNVKKSR
ncbi:MAG: hypothetical protein A2452_03905 [Candidatus Firestonebacteria bacterium RIFOXYC2_FULL_39_67]|nr:MAG: hypothetical protein A2536_08640 [Candidatus Firestonebacteria bacterium RIFOXYD2_FULL_39_29]OGF54708.1 MAG: hypothetical protein A2452_03905 [Candidatus Firestonebacteria bacterium RIFOXYC2_FULL_39_67]